MISRKHKKVCANLNYTEHFLLLACTITGCISVSAFSSLLGVPIRIVSSAIGLKIYAVTSRIKNCKLIIKNNGKETRQNSKLNSIEILISKALIDLNTSHDEFLLINNVLNKYDNMKEEIKNLKIYQLIEDFSLFIKQ